MNKLTQSTIIKDFDIKIKFVLFVISYHEKMNHSLETFLIEKGYTKTKLRLTKTNHFKLKVRINNCKGVFILDTGASSSCVGFEGIEAFNLKAEHSEIKAAGAGSIDMATQMSKNNKIKIGKWHYNKLALVLFDLTHINTALVNHDSTPIDGIIGADILKKGKAVIDYDMRYLYLKL